MLLKRFLSLLVLSLPAQSHSCWVIRVVYNPLKSPERHKLFEVVEELRAIAMSSLRALQPDLVQFDEVLPRSSEQMV